MESRQPLVLNHNHIDSGTVDGGRHNCNKEIGYAGIQRVPQTWVIKPNKTNKETKINIGWFLFEHEPVHTQHCNTMQLILND